MSDLVERLRRVKYTREEWHEPHGTMDVLVSADMANWEGVEASPLNPDGPEAAAHIETLQAELAEARAKVERARGDALEEAAESVVAYCAAQNEAKKEASFVDAVRAIRSLAKG